MPKRTRAAGQVLLMARAKPSCIHAVLALAAAAALAALTAALPDNDSGDDEHESEAAGEDVRPSAEDPLLVPLLLLFVRYGRVLHVCDGKEGVFGVV